MNEEKRLRLASAWLRAEHHQGSSDDQWAIMELGDLVANDPNEAWEVLQALVEHAATEWQLTMIGSAPLEDLLRDYDDTYLNLLEGVLTNRDRWASALQHVWMDRPVKRERVRTLIERFQSNSGR
jgi:hypothetical protein